MSLNFLPLPVYVLFCLNAFGLMIFFAAKRRKKDRRGLIIAYIIISCAPLLMIIGKVMPQYYEVAAKVIMIIIMLLFIEFTVIEVYDFFKGRLKKQTLIGLLLGWIVIIFFALILLRIIV